MVEQKLPQVGSIAICKISQILNYGVFVELVDFDNVRGFVHISQVASSWIKNIRNFVKEGQIRAAYVSSIDMSKGQIDLSFTKVSSSTEIAILNEWRSEQRNKKLLELLASQQKKSIQTILAEVAEPLVKEYGSLHAAFQTIAIQGESAVVGVPSSLVSPLAEFIKKNVEIPKKSIKGIFTINTLKPNGVELIKSAFASNVSLPNEIETELFYVGGGKYSLKVTSYNFKICERAINELTEKITKAMNASDGKVAIEFARAEA